MKVTNVIVDKLSKETNGVCGEFSVVLDNSLCIHKVLVINGEKGLFVAFPHSGTKYTEDNIKRYEDVVHPINTKLRYSIQSAVINKYNESLKTKG